MFANDSYSHSFFRQSKQSKSYFVWLIVVLLHVALVLTFIHINLQQSILGSQSHANSTKQPLGIAFINIMPINEASVIVEVAQTLSKPASQSTNQPVNKPASKSSAITAPQNNAITVTQGLQAHNATATDNNLLETINTPQPTKPAENIEKVTPPQQIEVAQSEQAKPDYDFNPQPNYPKLLREQGIEGVVWMRVWVDKKGQASKVTVLKSSGYRLLDAAALNAVMQWRFTPAKNGAHNVASWVEFPIRFSLTG